MITHIDVNLNKIQTEIKQAEQQFQRQLYSVKLLAISKGQSLEKIRAAVAAGQIVFGENYLQEALKKITALQQHALEWHFVGSIQANKTQAIAENFHWVHSVSRIKIAERLSQQRTFHLPPLNICIEVNVDNEPSKAGVTLAELASFVKAIDALPQLKLRGLMTIPEPQQDFNLQRLPYQKLRAAFNSLQLQGFSLDTLSMGMSQDYIAAIAEGSTIVRIGTALFGERINK